MKSGRAASHSYVSPNSYECTVTIDCVVFGFQEDILKILLLKRSINPFKEFWLLPGGPMLEGQTLEEAVEDVLFNLTGITGIHQQQIRIYSEIDRHPTKRVITVSYYALIRPENHPSDNKNYDAISELKWTPLKSLPDKLAFDHNLIVSDAQQRLRNDVEEKLLFGELLPEKFTMKELQDLYEAIMGETYDRRNFRKKIFSKGMLIKTGEIKKGQKGGPELYMLKAG